MSVSVIVTVRDEASSIDALLDGLAAQTLPPDEVVVVDGGSTDGTFERLVARAADDPRLVVHRVVGNRSVGRNAAVRTAAGELICCTDGGCVPERRWVELLVDTLRAGAEWVAGFYTVDADDPLARACGLALVPVATQLDHGFLPSARSMAFTRRAWTAVGGFPEDLDEGEDTAFGLALRAAGYDYVLRTDAVVRWRPPEGVAALARTAWRWGAADGRAGLRTAAHRRLLVTQLAAAAALPLGRRHPAALLTTLPYVTGVLRAVAPKAAVAGWALLPLLVATHGVAWAAQSAGWLAARWQRR